MHLKKNYNFFMSIYWDEFFVTNTIWYHRRIIFVTANYKFYDNLQKIILKSAPKYNLGLKKRKR